MRAQLRDRRRGYSLGVTLSNSLTELEAKRLEMSAVLDPARRQLFGQHFTPGPTAAIIAHAARLPATDSFRVLDAGAGFGMLSVAVATRVFADCRESRLELVAIEADEVVARELAVSFADLEREAAEHGRSLTTSIVIADFFEAASGFNRVALGSFDLVVTNPPYRKLSSSERLRLGPIGSDSPNLYAAFVSLGSELLKPGGQLVAITPRSFANGAYFDKFRKRFLSEMSLDSLHVFDSRSSVFAESKVLQENIIFAATRGGKRGVVEISESHDDKDAPRTRTVPYDAVVHPRDPESFIRIPAEHESAGRLLNFLPSNLNSLGLMVSTGRVVDFRSRSNLRDDPSPSSVPLVYPGNLRSGRIVWPATVRKPQGFQVLGASDEQLLFPEGNYVVVKRFSAKEERRRLTSAIWFGAAQPGPVAFENHLNVIHRNGNGLDLELAFGLNCWLNGTQVDSYFRTFSGHTQVNAGDLRSMGFPSEEALRRLGRASSQMEWNQDAIDAAVERLVGG